MKHVLSIAAAVLLLTRPALASDCPIPDLEMAGEASLNAMKPLEIEAAEQRSVEGGTWQIYREKDGRVHTIVRIDGGESGRVETRLSVLNRHAFTIGERNITYNRNYAHEGPFFFASEERKNYYFCDGKLVGTETGGEDYEKAGRELRDLFLNAKEIAGFTKGLAR